MKIQSVNIVGRRWFQKTYGNTYHTAEIFVNGERLHKTEEEYGYGDQYQETALQWLEKQGLINRRKYDNGGHESARAWAEKNKVQYSATVCDVRRERDL
jgi:hypothetical protein